MADVKLNDAQRSIQEKYSKISEVVKNAKNALIASRTSEGFVDKNYMDTPGVLAESTALIGLLLLVEAFYNNAVDEDGIINPVIKEVESIVDFEKDIDTIKDIQKSSLELINTWYEAEGFTAKPLVNRDYEDLFNKEDEFAAYIDSVTYILSATILSRWLDTQKKLVLDVELRELNTKLLIKSLDLLLKAQHDDGLWGFRADAKSESTLFFTYSAGVTIADFFDYILGEIAYTLYPDKNEDEQEALCEEFKDKELLNEINKVLGGDIEQRVIDARAKTQNWLLFECLSRMPKIAQCTAATEKEQDAYKNKLGMWIDTTDQYSKYFNLNYSYYLIDLMVVLSTDKRFNEICSDFNSEEWIKFDKACKEILDDQDYKYYFGKMRDANIADFWVNFVAQTIHASRAQYMVASRTGTKYWDKAELKVQWVHPDFEDECEAIANDQTNNKPVRDPAIVPMALRANTNFSYYISLQPDMEVDRLFKDICNELAVADSKYTVVDLWDQKNYNIQLTERSIEAVVDYYDYLNKYECSQLIDAQQTSNVQAAPTVIAKSSEKSPFEKALEDKIAEYLNSSEGQALIEKKVAEQISTAVKAEESTPDTVAGGIPSDAEIFDWMEGAAQLLAQSTNLSEIRGGLLEQLLDLFEELRVWSFRKALGESGLDWNQDKIATVSRDYEERRRALLKAVGVDVEARDRNDHIDDLEDLYAEVKKLRRK